MLSPLKKYALLIHTSAFLTIVLASTLLYPAAQSQADSLVWLLLGFVAVGNVLALLVN